MSRYIIDDVARAFTLHQTKHLTRRALLKGITAGLAVAGTGFVRRANVAAASTGNEQFVLDYYDAIQRHAWKTAYNLLGAKFHRAQTLQQFVDGFASTAFTTVEISHVTGQLSGNRYGVDVVIHAWLDDGTPQAFSGRYFVGREGGVAKIVDATIEVADASGLAPLCFASDLRTGLAGNAGTGHRFGDLTVVNQGAGCMLAGMPGVTIKDQNGKRLVSGKREPNSVMSAVTLEPGDVALLQLDWTNWCGSPIASDVTVNVSLPGSTGTLTVGHGFGVPPCLGDSNSASNLAVRPWQPG
jgi:hypothetical protein